jgi:hypothetical protein
MFARLLVPEARVVPIVYPLFLPELGRSTRTAEVPRRGIRDRRTPFGATAIFGGMFGRRKLAHGVEALFDGFDDHQVKELLEIGRSSSL